jgi:hypothetical protein
MSGWWLLISHLGAAMLGATLGVILMAILAVGRSAERIEHGAWRPDEHEVGPGR